MGGNQLVTERQAHKWYRQALTHNGCWAKEEEEDINVMIAHYKIHFYALEMNGCVIFMWMNHLNWQSFIEESLYN